MLHVYICSILMNIIALSTIHQTAILKNYHKLVSFIKHIPCFILKHPSANSLHFSWILKNSNSNSWVFQILYCVHFEYIFKLKTKQIRLKCLTLNRNPLFAKQNVNREFIIDITKTVTSNSPREMLILEEIIAVPVPDVFVLKKIWSIVWG